MRYYSSTITAMALNLRLSDDDNQKLAELAADTGTSKQQTLLKLIRDEWERTRARHVAHAELDRIYARRSELMDRLKDA